MNKDTAIQRMVNVIRRKHLSLETEKSYVGWLRRYMAFLRVDHHGGTSEQKMERYLTFLAREHTVSASTQNQAFNAIRFFYIEVLKQDLGNINALRAKRPEFVRTAPDRETMRRFLACVQDVHGYPTRLIVGLLYGIGMRLKEPLNLRIKDVNLADSLITIRGAKGGKDRVRSIPCCLMTALQRQIHRARFIFEEAHAQNVPTKLPGGLGRKYPAAEHSWAWFWLFPSKKWCLDRRDNNRKVWYHMHEANVQLACKHAAAEIEMHGVITPHVLRHAWATHALQAGENIKAIQSALGHVSLDTTSGYLHESAQVASPLDRLISLPSPTIALPEKSIPQLCRDNSMPLQDR